MESEKDIQSKQAAPENKAAQQAVKRKTFGTFAGVFTPTTLTILGVIMYIRLPWVVGNAGVIGALLIVLLSVSITFATALSISSIATNVRIGAGGAFSVITQSLGLEIGGAIGVPFYFAQAIAVAMYIFGFREGLQSLLPDADPLLLDMAIFAGVMLIAFISTSFAFKIQYVILAIIVLSLIAIYGSLFKIDVDLNKIELFGKYPGAPENGFKGTNFWGVFAVFFPAVTGVMAGANMSGDLTDPRKSIPQGTISAVIVTTIIYITLVFVAALIASPSELVSNYNVFIDKSLFPPIVLAGLLGATLSAAIGSFVGAPRILLALGQKGILPKSDFLAKTSAKGEPYNAMVVTAVVVLLGILLRNLNTIAPLLTMFFMITYAMVNIVALIESSLSLPSFRPTLKVPFIVPLIGAAGSITVMFIMNGFVALISLIFIIAFYFYLVRQKLSSSAADSRSGLFSAIAEWATQKTTELSPTKEARSWRPDLMIPMRYPRDIRSSFKLISSLVYPKGSIKLIAIQTNDEKERQILQEYIPEVEKKFREQDILISHTTLSGYHYNEAMSLCMQSLKAAFFRPNTILVTIDSNSSPEELKIYDRLLLDAQQQQYGVLFYIPYSTVGLAMEKSISLWLNEIPADWKESFNCGNNDLAILTTILIERNWNGNVWVNFVNPPFESEEDMQTFAERVRFTKKTVLHQRHGDLAQLVPIYRKADLNIISIPQDMQTAEMIDIVKASRVSALFCSDSTLENAFV